MYTGMLHTHRLVVILFLLIYLIKTILLFLNKNEALQKFTKKTRIAEMIISTLFLATGIYLAANSGVVGPWLWIKIAAVAVSIPLAVVGFKKQLKVPALLSLLLLIYAYGISETKSPVFAKEQVTLLSSGDRMVVGKDVYTRLCTNCHGENGNAMKSGAKDLTKSALTREDKINRIMNGKNAMPAYSALLSNEQLQAVADYIETFKQP